jgi:hypothetical protein
MEQNKLRSLLLTAELPDSAVNTAPDSLPLQSPPSSANPASDLGGLLEFTAETPRGKERDTHGLNLGPLPPPASGLGGLPAHFAALIPTLMELKTRLLEELESNPLKLRALNVSRREALAQHLDRMAGHAPGPNSVGGNLDPAGGLRRWIEGPRSANQNLALQAYFEEIALLVLGQALLLKAWSDRGVRAWSKTDLGQLNWALSTALRPHVPLDRESWQLTRQNIYSWYNPSPGIQDEIWSALESWRITDEGPSFITFLMGPARQARLPEGCAPSDGYDPRFFKAVWDHCPLFGFNPAADTGPLRRSRVVFSPTLRDGSMVRTGPISVGWIGLETSAFMLMAAELVQLWWGPAAPPLWAVGNGLEVHARDQLALALGSPKPSLLSRITEMEACDAAFLLEERAVRPQGRSLEAQRLREQLDSLPYFRKLRSAGTSLGDLQACVALSKLRPGGLLWWAREEPLTGTDGAEMLHFLLERGKVVCEWDFSELDHSLPVNIPLFPKHLYLIAREPRVEERLNHRPQRVLLQGQIRSHVEIPLVLQDALSSIHRTVQPHGHWQVHVQKSPTVQKDWMERWPDPTCQNQVRLIETIRQASLPLASSTMVKLTPEGDATKEHQWSVHPSMRGLWLRGDFDGEKRRLVAETLPRPGNETKGSGFMVLVPDESWVAPLMAYLRSEEVRGWLEHHADRKGDRWILNEQTIRFIPVPKILLRALGVPTALESTDAQESAAFALPLPGEWEKWAAEIPHHPGSVRDALTILDEKQQRGEVQAETASRIRASLFVRSSRALEQMISGQGRLLSIVTPDGRIRWRELLDILPKSECSPITFSPRVKVVGQIPPYLPIGRFDRIRMPQPGILLSTELGLNTQIFADSSTLLDMIWEQLDGLVHPTWSELIQYLRVPRRVEIAEATASDVLRSHGEQSQRLKELRELVAACRLF